MGDGKGHDETPYHTIHDLEMSEINVLEESNKERSASFFRHPTIVERISNSSHGSCLSIKPTSKEHIIKRLKNIGAFLRAQDTFPYILAFSIVIFHIFFSTE